MVQKLYILSCDFGSIERHRVVGIDRVGDPCSSLTLAQGLDGILTVDAAAAVMNHLGANASPLVGCSSVGEQDFVYLEESLLVVDEKVKKVVLVLIGEITQFDPVLGE